VQIKLSGAIYGTITAGALLAAEFSRRESYGKTIFALVLALVLYWLAHAYAANADRRIREQQKLTLKSFASDLLHELPILGGASIPLLAIVIFGLAGASLGTAISAALWTAAAVIAAIELTAAIRSGVRGRALVVHAVIGIVLGLLVPAINAVLQH
jgi:hypothetical protein